MNKEIASLIQRPFVGGILGLLCLALFSTACAAQTGNHLTVHLGLRPLLLVEELQESPLKTKLESCAAGPFRRSDFSIGHRGAPLMYPEHTRESYEAAARMGAGIVECDVTFTKDKALVCRHSQCDLHSTTNILSTDLARKCRSPFQAAVLDEEGNLLEPATAECCTSDITLAEFKTLEGRWDSFDSAAATPREAIGGVHETRGRLLSHRESIALFKRLGVKMAPELKSASVSMPFKGMSQADYAQKFVDEYKQAGVAASRVWPQSFDLRDVLYWIEQEPAFGQQAVYLEDRDSDPLFDHRDPASWTPSMEELANSGLSIIAPPIWMLLEVEDGDIRPSPYAKAAKAAGLDIIAWTLERSGSLETGGGWYYQTLNGDNPNPADPHPGVINSNGDTLRVLNALAREVEVIGVFSDWPATVTYYANCMSLK